MRVVADGPGEEKELCDGNGIPRKKRPFHGCYMCCRTCDLDAHRCPGCGAELNHGIDVCLGCRNRKDL